MKKHESQGAMFEFFVLIALGIQNWEGGAHLFAVFLALGDHYRGIILLPPLSDVTKISSTRRDLI